MLFVFKYCNLLLLMSTYMYIYSIHRASTASTMIESFHYLEINQLNKSQEVSNSKTVELDTKVERWVSSDLPKLSVLVHGFNNRTYIIRHFVKL